MPLQRYRGTKAMMKLVILTAAAVAMGAAAHAADTVKLTQVMIASDAAMTCDELLAETGAMEGILGGSPHADLLAGNYTAIAQRTAVMGGAGRAAGAIGAVGGGKASKKKLRVIAEKRWIYLTGLYEGRNCAAAPAFVAETQP